MRSKCHSNSTLKRIKRPNFDHKKFRQNPDNQLTLYWKVRNQNQIKSKAGKRNSLVKGAFSQQAQEFGCLPLYFWFGGGLKCRGKRGNRIRDFGNSWYLSAGFRFCWCHVSRRSRNQSFNLMDKKKKHTRGFQNKTLNSPQHGALLQGIWG